jgi:flagellar biosynthetic protein FliQ
MNEAQVMDIARNALLVTLKLAMPVLLVGLIVGILVSLLQAVTQIQEFTLSFVPKLIAIITVLAILGPWMLTTMTAFFSQTFLNIPTITR